MSVYVVIYPALYFVSFAIYSAAAQIHTHRHTNTQLILIRSLQMTIDTCF